MKKIRRIVPIVLIICMLFSTTAFGAVKKPGYVKNIKINESAVGIVISYSYVTNASGYRIYYSESPNSGYKYVQTTSSSEYIELEPSKTYYIKVRAYRTYNNKKYFGPYSSVYTVTTKNCEPSFYSSVNDTYSNILISPYPGSYDAIIDMNSMYLYDTVDKKILTKLKPVTYIYDEAKETPVAKTQQYVNFDKLKVEDSNFAIVWFEQETRKATLDNKRHAIIYSVDYNDKHFIVKAIGNEMEYAEINWKK